ncbi:MAG TPA: dTMP kinase [Chitinophagaceae bacterium]|jgi:dTMP kinase|nr:dTMP kinase [Chitinophagaceae bacterium]
MKKNFFIALEGLDGSGKSTQIKLLAEKLKGQGLKIYTTAEPTNSRIGHIIKDIFKHKMEADHRTIAALYAADRLDHLTNNTDGILKKMEEGYTVITDRYYFSSYAYHGTHMDINWVITANSLSADLLRPDLNIYIDISPEESMRRLNKGRDSIELYESIENLKNVKDKYFEAFEILRGRENVSVVNGNRPKKEIANEIWNEVSKLVGYDSHHMENTMQ